MGGLRALIEVRLGDSSFGWRFPQTWPDGSIPCGCDERAFKDILEAEVPGEINVLINPRHADHEQIVELSSPLEIEPVRVDPRVVARLTLVAGQSKEQWSGELPEAEKTLIGQLC